MFQYQTILSASINRHRKATVDKRKKNILLSILSQQATIRLRYMGLLFVVC